MDYRVKDHDPQQWKVYEAENEAKKAYGTETLNPVTIQMLAKDIQRHPELIASYPAALKDRFKIVIKGKTRTSAYFFMDTIFLPKWAHEDWIVCHEVSHMIDHRHNGYTDEGHGPNFCAIYLDVVRAVISEQASDTLRQSFEKHDVSIF